MALFRGMTGTGFGKFMRSPGIRKVVDYSKGQNAGWYYGDPAFQEQERMLRQRVGQDVGQMRQGLVARGYSPEAARRKLMRATIGAQSQFRQLGAEQAGLVRQRAEEAKERKRARRRGILGGILSLGTQFGGQAYGSWLKRQEQKSAKDLGLNYYGG